MFFCAHAFANMNKRRRNHDFKRIPLFGLLFLVCGELTPLGTSIGEPLVFYFLRPSTYLHAMNLKYLHHWPVPATSGPLWGSLSLEIYLKSKEASDYGDQYTCLLLFAFSLVYLF